MLRLRRQGIALSLGEDVMKKLEVYLGSLLWIAVATALPMAALEPVTLSGAARGPVFVLAGCADGSEPLLMGCADSLI
jgi:hypothetical protein